MTTKTLNFLQITIFFENFVFPDLWSLRYNRCQASRCPNDVICCKMTSSRQIFMNILGFVFHVNIFLLWKFQVECMFQNENIVPKLTGGQTDRCQNDVTVCHMTLWRQILIKVTGNIFLPNILLLWKFQGDCTIRSEIMVVFIFSQNRKYAESCTPAEETPPVISVVYHRWSWNFHRIRRIDKN